MSLPELASSGGLPFEKIMGMPTTNPDSANIPPHPEELIEYCQLRGEVMRRVRETSKRLQGGVDRIHSQDPRQKETIEAIIYEFAFYQFGLDTHHYVPHSHLLYPATWLSIFDQNRNPRHHPVVSYGDIGAWLCKSLRRNIIDTLLCMEDIDFLRIFIPSACEQHMSDTKQLFPKVSKLAIVTRLLLGIAHKAECGLEQLKDLLTQLIDVTNLVDTMMSRQVIPKNHTAGRGIICLRDLCESLIETFNHEVCVFFSPTAESNGPILPYELVKKSNAACMLSWLIDKLREERNHNILKWLFWNDANRDSAYRSDIQGRGSLLSAFTFQAMIVFHPVLIELGHDMRPGLMSTEMAYKFKEVLSVCDDSFIEGFFHEMIKANRATELLCYMPKLRNDTHNKALTYKLIEYENCKHTQHGRCKRPRL